MTATHNSSNTLESIISYSEFEGKTFSPHNTSQLVYVELGIRPNSYHDNELPKQVTFEIAQKLRDVYGISYENMASDMYGNFVFLNPDPLELDTLHRMCSAFGTRVRLGCENRVAIRPRITCIDTKRDINAENLLRNLQEVQRFMEVFESDKKVILYDDELDTNIKLLNATLDTLDDIEDDPESTKLDFYGQPIVNQDGIIDSVELLARMKLRNGSAVSPDFFIPVAERYGHIDTIGIRAVLCAVQYIRRLPPPISVSCNLAPEQLVNGGVDRIINIIREHEIGDRISFELTESQRFRYDDRVKRLEELKAHCKQIAIDDFGSGYSNLGTIFQFNDLFSRIKLPKERTWQMANSLKAKDSVFGLISPLIDHGIELVLEGVENPQIRSSVLGENVLYQGFVYSKPLPIDQLIDYIHQTNG